MDVTENQALSLEIKEYTLPKFQSTGMSSKTVHKDVTGHANIQPELLDQDELFGAMFQTALVPSSHTSRSVSTRATEAARQAPPTTARNMIIHLVRHAEGPHNLRSIPENERVEMLDPGLTQYGISQCKLLSQRFHAMDKITHIISSPLKRTLHTALIAFKPAIDRGIQVHLVPDLRECGDGPCNTGSNITELVEELLSREEGLRKGCIDVSRCYPDWELHTEFFTERKKRRKRADNIKSSLFHLGQMGAAESNDDVEIVVVSHSWFIKELEHNRNTQAAFFNAEYKSFHIVEDGNSRPGLEKFTLVETEESKRYVHTFPEAENAVE